mmetsp:Transcript_32572/g.51872  ORF Transcript_32572/g.51872 Transcript_32572/m.51872 type:complete len:87 (+) Transcript_32572:3233-3493(+)
MWFARKYTLLSQIASRNNSTNSVFIAKARPQQLVQPIRASAGEPARQGWRQYMPIYCHLHRLNCVVGISGNDRVWNEFVNKGYRFG